MAGTCGAVTGAFMILGLKYSHIEAKDEKGREKTYAQVRQFVSMFEQRNGTIICKDLLNCDINIGEELRRAREGKKNFLLLFVPDWLEMPLIY